MRQGIAIGVAAVLVVVVTAAAGAVASGLSDQGQIGGPPTIKLGPPDEGKRTSPALVIGRGRSVGGSAEIVAYGWEGGEDSLPADFCVWVQQLSDEFPLFGACDVAPWRAGSIGMEIKIQSLQPRSARATYIGGLVSPDVASVRLSFRRPGAGRWFRAKPILGKVQGELQERLHQPAPFGFYYAQVNGLVRFRHVRAQALDAEGRVIGKWGARTPAGQALR